MDKNPNIYLALLASLFVSACGSDSAEPAPPQPPIDNLTRCEAPLSLVTAIDRSQYRLLTEANYYRNQNHSLIIQSKSHSQQWRYQWRQIAGPALTLLSPTSPVLAFEATQAGSYQFEVSIELPGANTSIEQVTIEIIDETPALLARLDHQVVEGNNVSFRLDGAATPTQVSWCIQSGPDLGLDVSQPLRPLFTAPQVNADTLSVLKVQASVNGQVHTDRAYALITQEPTISSSYFDEPVARVHAYRASNYQKALESCIYSNSLVNTCTIARLPLIGQTSNANNIDAILERVLVSHPWMGDNFALFLRQMDPNSDFVNLLQSVSAIIISYDVRPSFYWVVTGAIYLDPSDLWLTPSERDTINEAPDYRSGFGDELQFYMPWRYVKNNQYASSNIPINVRESRSLADIEADFASLLYHELAHANDFFPRSVHQQLVGDTFIDAYNARNDAGTLVSSVLTQAYPLQSDAMQGLAQVRFRGASVSAAQKQYLPADISGFFNQDVANDFYNYSTIREDAAMLFEEVMMSYRLGVLRDVAVTDKPASLTADSIVVEWGQRGRIGDNSLASRAAFVIDAMLPEQTGDKLISSLPEPILMTPGRSWAANLAISPNTIAPSNRSMASPLRLPEVNVHGRHQGLTIKGANY